VDDRLPIRADRVRLGDVGTEDDSMKTPIPAHESEHEVLVMERAALLRWCHGDPSGFLEISDRDVSYFDPFRIGRIDGLTALTSYYEVLRGTVSVTAWQILEPRVTEIGEITLLSYRFRSWVEGGATVGWNCSEVFRRRAEGWRIVHTHWSFTAPETTV
jgi:hypothetical protein